MWTEIGGIPSQSSRNTRYAISVNEDGDLGCNCASWIHSKDNPKKCKHTMGEQAGAMLRLHHSRQRQAAVRRGGVTLTRHNRWPGAYSDVRWLGSSLYAPYVTVSESRLEALERLAAQAQEWYFAGVGTISERGTVRGALTDLGR